MRFDIVFTTEALEDLRLFRKGERTRIIEAIEEQLSHEPNHETRNRKRLRPNQTAEWVLRVDRFRVFYDIEESAHLVKVEAVWYKRGRRLFIHGEEDQLWKTLPCPSEPPGSNAHLKAHGGGKRIFRPPVGKEFSL